MHFSNEQQFLIRVLKGDHPSSLGEVDSQQLFLLFQRHRLLPLATSIVPLLPEKEGEQWEQAIRRRSLQSLQFSAQLHSILEALRREGISAIPLKGPALAHALYGDAGQRHIRDLDLLVSPDQLTKALKVLKDLAYQMKFPGRELREDQWTYYFRHQYDVLLTEDRQGGMLELHTHLAWPGLKGVDEDRFTSRLTRVEMNGGAVQCMSREATFLYLALHGAHHLFFRLFWLRDLAKAMSSWEMDHKLILQMTEEMGLERILGVGLKLCQNLCDTPVPECYALLLKEEAGPISRMEKRCLRAMSDPNFRGWRNRLNVLLFTMDMKPGCTHKIATITAVLHRWVIRKRYSG